MIHYRAGVLLTIGGPPLVLGPAYGLRIEFIGYEEAFAAIAPIVAHVPLPLRVDAWAQNGGAPLDPFNLGPADNGWIELAGGVTRFRLTNLSTFSDMRLNVWWSDRPGDYIDRPLGRPARLLGHSVSIGGGAVSMTLGPVGATFSFPLNPDQMRALDVDSITLLTYTDVAGGGNLYVNPILRGPAGDVFAQTLGGAIGFTFAMATGYQRLTIGPSAPAGNLAIVIPHAMVVNFSPIGGARTEVWAYGR